MTSMLQTSPLLLRAAPLADPPYDDEVAARPMVAGSLALAFPDAGAGVPLRLVPPAMGDADPPERTARATLPDPHPWTARLAQAMAEVLVGARPAGQLTRFATLEVLERLERRSDWRPRAGRGPAVRPIVRSVHVCEPDDGVAEGCTVVDTGGRRRVLALRLEGLDGRWRCTAAQIG
jgi:Family of unknown function (DUF6459)